MKELYDMLLNLRDDISALYRDEWSDSEREEREEYGESCDLYDLVYESLDIEYVIDSRFRLVGTHLTLAWGGPNIYLNTDTDTIEGYWGNDHETVYIDSDISEAINDILKDNLPF